MSLGDRFRGWLGGSGNQTSPTGPTRRRVRPQAQPIGPLGHEQRPLQRAQWLGLGLAAASAVALTAGLVFIILTLTRPADPRAVATPTVGAVAVASPTPLPVSAIFATATPTVAPTATVPPLGEGAQVANTEGQGVNLRAEPSTTGERLKVIPEGSLVSIIGPDRDAEGRRWRNVRDPEGQVGWVPAAFLVPEGTAPPPSGPVASEPTGPAAPPAPAQPAAPKPAAAAPPAAKPTASRSQVGNTNGQGANIRSEPGGGGRVLKTLAEGTAVEVLGPEREADGRVWRQVRDPTGVTGWIVGGALVAPGSIPTPAPPGARATATPAGTAGPAGTAAPAATTAPTAGPTTAPPGPPPVLAPPGATPAPAPAATPTPTPAR